jgi:hypothetical protein
MPKVPLRKLLYINGLCELQRIENTAISAFRKLKHDFGRYGLALEADAAQIALRWRPDA